MNYFGFSIGLLRRYGLINKAGPSPLERTEPLVEVGISPILATSETVASKTSGPRTNSLTGSSSAAALLVAVAKSADPCLCIPPSGGPEHNAASVFFFISSRPFGLLAIAFSIRRNLCSAVRCSGSQAPLPRNRLPEAESCFPKRLVRTEPASSGKAAFPHRVLPYRAGLFLSFLPCMFGMSSMHLLSHLPAFPFLLLPLSLPLLLRILLGSQCLDIDSSLAPGESLRVVTPV